MCCAILRDRALAEDAVQETFLKAYKTLDTFRKESSEKTWLMRIAINTCRDFRRSAWFRYLDRRVTPEDLPLAATPAEEDSIALTAAIMRLPQKLQETARLRRENPEATLSELAEMPNPPVSKSAVNHRMRKLMELSKTL